MMVVIWHNMTIIIVVKSGGWNALEEGTQERHARPHPRDGRYRHPCEGRRGPGGRPGDGGLRAHARRLLRALRLEGGPGGERPGSRVRRVARPAAGSGG